MASILNLPFYQQIGDGYCLAACTQMALAYLGIVRSQEDLAHELGLRISLGVPASNITRLRTAVLSVICREGSLQVLIDSLTHDIPVIAFVQAGELPHWAGCHSQHAVVIVGADQLTVQLLDPGVSDAPVSVPIGDFLLAWGEMDNLYATITRNAR